MSIEVKKYNQEGKDIGSVTLSDEVFVLPWNDVLVHQVVMATVSNMRQNTAHTKFRSEVAGGGAKPHRQKGTGRARHGSRRSPIWVGGGITFGPRREKSYAKSVNEKMKKKAFFMVLSDKLRNNSISFLESMSMETPSTKKAIDLIDKICGEKTGKCLVVFDKTNANAQKSFSNIPGVLTRHLDVINTRDVLMAKNVIFVNPEEVINNFNRKSEVIKKQSNN